MEKREKNVWFNPVFLVPLIFTIGLAVMGFVIPNTFEAIGNQAYSILTGNFSWLYTIVMTSFVIYCIWIGFISPYGKVKLGSEDSKPEYKTVTWFAMLFSAGMGIGLVFYGVAEPVAHYINPANMEGLTDGARAFAMEKSFLHWGLHPWANYCVLGLALAYAQYKRNSPALVSSIFNPILEGKTYGRLLSGLIDGLAVFATIAGMATSLGLGTMQITAGLNYLFGIETTTTLMIGIVVIITLIYTGTAVLGIDKGISVISNLNMVLAVMLLFGTFVFGPTVKILGTFLETTGSYAQHFIQNATMIGIFSESDWYANWTIYYWAWWIAWAPFTGTFIARISKGRTIREFVAGVLTVPAVVSFIWFAIFGAVSFAQPDTLLHTASADISTTFFIVMQNIPFGKILNIIALILLFTFFITSANSATFVLGMLSEEGSLHPKKSIMGVWGIVMSAMALALMVGTENGLQMIQTISITGAFPFAFVMIGMMYALVKALEEDHSKV